MYLPCVIKTVVLTYTINIIIRIQVHRDAFILIQDCHSMYQETFPPLNQKV